MTWRVYWDAFAMDELTEGSVYQKIEIKKNLVLVGVRTWVCIQSTGPLVLEGLKMRIVSPSERLVLYESTNSFDRDDLHEGTTPWSKVKEIYFEFDNATLREGEDYNFGMIADTYTGGVTNARSFGWRKAYPDPVYPAKDYTPNQTTVAVSPYEIYLIGDKL